MENYQNQSSLLSYEKIQFLSYDLYQHCTFYRQLAQLSKIAFKILKSFRASHLGFRFREQLVQRILPIWLTISNSLQKFVISIVWITNGSSLGEHKCIIYQLFATESAQVFTGLRIRSQRQRLGERSMKGVLFYLSKMNKGDQLKSYFLIFICFDFEKFLVILQMFRYFADICADLLRLDLLFYCMLFSGLTLGKQKDISQLFKERLKSQLGALKGSAPLQISNKQSKYRLMFGQEFKSMLEPRDQVMEHQFDFQIQLTENNINTIKEGMVPDIILENIKKFLVESASNVASAAFKFLCKGDLTAREAKEFASKNIMLNINSIMKETILGIKEVDETGLKIKQQKQVRQILQNQGISEEKIDHILTKNWDQLEKFRNILQKNEIIISQLAKKLQKISIRRKNIIQHLTYSVDNIMSDILTNLAGNYPQAPAAGGTPRMREALRILNKMQDIQNDLIYANKINIGQYIEGYQKTNWGNSFEYGQRDRTYTKFIMKVINTAINATRTEQNSQSNFTYSELFNQFNDKLFWFARKQKQHKLFNKNPQKSELINFFAHSQIQKNPYLNQNQKEAQETKQTQQPKGTKQTSQAKQKPQVSQVNQKNKSKETKEQEKNLKQRNITVTYKGQSQIQKKFKQYLATDQNKSKYQWGQKVPKFVQQFSSLEIKSENFTAKHSSILRILTKWSESLEQIFQNPEKNVPKIVKTVDNQRIQLDDIDGYPQLIKQVKQEYQQVKKKLKILAKNVYKLMGQFLSESSKNNSSINRYTETRIVASKINAVLTHHMLTYTNVLIDHLLKAGQRIWVNDGFKTINLVVFQVSDLLRSKLQCNENTFIRVLQTMYLLDNDSRMIDRFKLLRIKNKLNSSANNIIINYLFMGKVQCELQLSIQQSKGKDHEYYDFSHFVYELTRGKFGAISECAIMVSQLDKMITDCKKKYYEEKKGRKVISREDQYEQEEDKKQGVVEAKQEKKEQLDADESENFKDKVKNFFFECSDYNCKRLVTDHSIVRQKDNQRICNRCIIMNKQNVQKLLKNQKLKQCLSTMQRMIGLEDLKQEMKTSYIAILSNKGELNLFFTIFVQEERKKFLIKVDQNILSMERKVLDFRNLDYYNITNPINDNHSRLMYFIKDLSQLSQQFLQLTGLSSIQTNQIEDKIKIFEEEFKKFRLEKAMIKNIKFKVGVIDISMNVDKWETLDHVVETLVLSLPKHKEKKKSKNQGLCNLRYNKYQHLNMNSITEINAKKINLKQLPFWIGLLNNLKSLNFSQNQLEIICKGQFPSSLVDLDLQQNSLTSIDLSNLTQLTNLNLFYNCLEAIDLTNLINLTDLNLISNRLKAVDISTLKSIKRLTLMGNQLQNIELNNLVNLIDVDLADNQLKFVDLSSLTSIKRLTLYKNQLTKISLGNLRDLVYADISYNLIEQIDITNNTDLEQLDLTENALNNVQLNEQLITLKIYNNLNLDSNILLPDSLQQLHADRVFIIQKDFMCMSNLKQLRCFNGLTQRGQLKNLRKEVNFQYLGW